MIVTESVFFGEKPVGQIFGDTKTGNLAFFPIDHNDHRMKEIAQKIWQCPRAIRHAIIAQMSNS